MVEAGRVQLRADAATHPDTAHRQLLGWVADTAHPAYAAILSRTGEPPMKPVFKRITPFWERDE